MIFLCVLFLSDSDIKVIVALLGTVHFLVSNGGFSLSLNDWQNSPRENCVHYMLYIWCSYHQGHYKGPLRLSLKTDISHKRRVGVTILSATSFCISQTFAYNSDLIACALWLQEVPEYIHYGSWDSILCHYRDIVAHLGQDFWGWWLLWGPPEFSAILFGSPISSLAPMLDSGSIILGDLWGRWFLGEARYSS